MLILWAEGVATSLRQRTETTDLTGLMRAFGTTDTALLLARFTHGLQRLRALEAEVLAGPPNPTTDKQRAPTGAVASPRIPSAPEPPTLTPPTVPSLTPERRTAPPVRATGPPRTPSQSEKPPTGPNHPLAPRGMVGPAMPIPRPPVPAQRVEAQARIIVPGPASVNSSSKPACGTRPSRITAPFAPLFPPRRVLRRLLLAPHFRHRDAATREGVSRSNPSLRHGAESFGACFFMIRDGRPITPPVTSSILESITRASQLDLLEEITDKPVVPAMKWFFRPNASLVLEQRDIDRTELYAARRPSRAAQTTKCSQSSASIGWMSERARWAS